MRKITVACLLLSVLLPAVLASAAADPNTLGLFYDATGTVDQVSIDANTMQVLYLVLMNPVNDDYEGSTRDVGYVSGFECGLVPPSGDLVLGVDFPAMAVNVGSTSNLIVGYGTAVPVSSSRAATLASVRVLTFGNNREGYRLAQASPPSLQGSLAFVDAEDPGANLVAMMPVSGAFDRAVFCFGDWKLREQAPWGEIKSLFR
jgi:hypothetical protein